MNYIYFNEKGRLKKSTIEDLYAGSVNNDTIYIFADFDKDGPIEYEVSLMFERSDGFKVGPVEAMIDSQENPITNELMRCYSFLMGGDILAVAGPLQITARYHSSYVDPELEITEEAIKATSMVIANVNETVPLGAGSSTLLLNLNRKIVNLDEKVSNHINDFVNHDHNNLYYEKEEIELNFGKELDVTAFGNIKLLGGQGNTLSSVAIPTTVLTQPPGNLVHSGRGRFIFEKDKLYFINIIGTLAPTFTMFEYESFEGNVNYYPLGTINVSDFNYSQTMKLTQINYVFETEFEVSGDVVIVLDGTSKTFSFDMLAIPWEQRENIRLGLNGNYHYEVYEV